jgi:uncharacterized protein YggE
MEVEPDRDDLRLGASHMAPTREEAMVAVDEVARRLRDQLGAVDGVEVVTIGWVRCSAEYDYSDSNRRLMGFRASTWGTARCTPGAVARAAAVVTECRGDIQGVSWMLEDDNPAHREVRRRAVDAARLAAEDFAVAIGRPLGPLNELADAGMSDGRPVASLASLAAHSSPFEVELELDPEPVEISASVEARFTA